MSKQSALPLLAAIVFSSLFAGCQSPNLSQRIESGQEAFDSWPAEVQETVSEGQIAVGFSREQVRMAWGEPDHIGVETTAEGKTERWLYEKGSPAFGIGLGVGSFGGSGGVGGSVGTTVGGKSNIIAMARFQQGAVVSFERAGNEE